MTARLFHHHATLLMTKVHVKLYIRTPLHHNDFAYSDITDRGI